MCETEKSSQSCSHKRRVNSYPPEKTLANIDRYVKRTGDSISNLIAEALREYFINHPEPKR